MGMDATDSVFLKAFPAIVPQEPDKVPEGLESYVANFMKMED